MIVLTGEGPLAFCSGGDQRVRGDTGYVRRGRRRSAASTSPTCTCRSAACPSRWWRWSPATRSAAATSCTSSATSRSPPTTRASARPARGSARSTAASAPRCSPTSSARRRRRRSGSCAASTTRSRRWRWGSSTPSCRSTSSRTRPSVVPRDARALALRAAAAQGELQRRRGRLQRHPAARARREPALLRVRRGARGPRGLQGEAPARLLAVPPDGLEPAAHLADGRAAADAARGGRAVLVGTALAATEGTFQALTFVAALLGAMFIQVGTNLSNDYSDARRGADTEDRLGPVRVTAGGLVPPRQVLVATYVAFGAGGAGRRLPDRHRRLGAAAGRRRRRSSPACSTPAGRGRTATRASARCSCSCSSASSRWPAPTSPRSSALTWEAFALAVPVGLLASAILVVNNVRDLETDRRAGKRTLAVRLGRARARDLYAAMVYGAFLSAPLPWLLGLGELSAWLLLPLLALPLAVPLVRTVRDAHRRAVAERRAGAHRACCSSCSACCCRRDPGELMAELDRRLASGCALRAPLQRRLGRADASASCCACGSTRDGDVGDGEAAPLEPYDGVPLAAAVRGAGRLRGGAGARRPRSTHAELLAACARRAAAAAGAGGDRPRAVGPRRPPRGRPGRAADRGRRRDARSPSTRRSAPTTARARPRRRPRRPRPASGA